MYWTARNLSSVCTTGFPIRHVSTGGAGNLSAHHCEPTPGRPWDYGQSAYSGPGQLVGTSTQRKHEADLLNYINGVTNNLSAGVALGGIGGSSSSYNIYPINGYLDPAVGQSICGSGSYSGSNCGAVIVDKSYNYAFSTGRYTSGHRAIHPEGRAMWGNGDSGGPVGVHAGRPEDNRFGLYGTGIISGMNANREVPCNGIPTGNGRECSTDVIIAPIAEHFAIDHTWLLVRAA